MPASPGRVTGSVRVIRGPDEFDELQAGEILVAPLTAPAWTPLFTRAAAVVTDVGSAASHASIIAREYGIPAVVGCVDATSRLHTGMRVTVDGAPETSSELIIPLRLQWRGISGKRTTVARFLTAFTGTQGDPGFTCSITACSGHPPASRR